MSRTLADLLEWILVHLEDPVWQAYAIRGLLETAEQQCYYDRRVWDRLVRIRDWETEWPSWIHQLATEHLCRWGTAEEINRLLPHAPLEPHQQLALVCNAPHVQRSMMARVRREGGGVLIGDWQRAAVMRGAAAALADSLTHYHGGRLDPQVVIKYGNPPVREVYLVHCQTLAELGDGRPLEAYQRALRQADYWSTMEAT